MASWERNLLGHDMVLEVTHTDSTSTVFHNVAVDSTRYRDGLLTFESDDTQNTILYSVPDVKYWETYYR
jgi:hypothetical protein